MTHLRVNPTMPMNQSRNLLGIGHRRYKMAKANVSSTDNDIIRFHKSNPNATHLSIKKTLCVGIEHYQLRKHCMLVSNAFAKSLLLCQYWVLRAPPDHGPHYNEPLAILCHILRIHLLPSCLCSTNSINTSTLPNRR